MQELTISLFAPSVTADQVASAAEILARNAIEIESGVLPITRPDTDAPAYRLRGRVTTPLSDAQRTAILDQAERVGIDVFLQTVEEAGTRPRMFVFDLDSTLIQAEVIDELAKLAGVGEHVSGITERAMRGEIDFLGALAERVSLLAGLKVSRLSELQRTIKFSPGVENLMKGLRTAGCVTVVVSGGFGIFARYAQERLGFDYLFCNELDIADGKLTGGLVGPRVDAERKRTALLEIAQRERIPQSQIVAVGDGANDIPMLAEAAAGIAYRAKPVVRAAARYRLTFARLDSLLYLLD